MKQRPTGRPSSEKIIRDIKRNTRKQYSAEECPSSNKWDRCLKTDTHRTAPGKGLAQGSTGTETSLRRLLDLLGARPTSGTGNIEVAGEGTDKLTEVL